MPYIPTRRSMYVCYRCGEVQLKSIVDSAYVCQTQTSKAICWPRSARRWEALNDNIKNAQKCPFIEFNYFILWYRDKPTATLLARIYRPVPYNTARASLKIVRNRSGTSQTVWQVFHLPIWPTDMRWWLVTLLCNLRIHRLDTWLCSHCTLLAAVLYWTSASRRVDATSTNRDCMQCTTAFVPVWRSAGNECE